MCRARHWVRGQVQRSDHSSENVVVFLNQLTVLRELLGGFGAENVSVDRNLELAGDIVVPTRVDLTARAEE